MNNVVSNFLIWLTSKIVINTDMYKYRIKNRYKYKTRLMLVLKSPFLAMDIFNSYQFHPHFAVLAVLALFNKYKHK